MSVAAAAEIDHHRSGQEQKFVFISIDLDAVGIGSGEPGFADPADGFAFAGEGVFVVDQISLGVKIVGAENVDGESAMPGGKRILANDGLEIVAVKDFVSGTVLK